MAETCRFF